MLSVGKAVGFEAWVESKEDRVRLNEYQVTHHPAEDGKSAYAECYLETIHQISRLPTLEDQRDIQVSAYVDGHLLLTYAWLGRNVSCQWDRIVQKKKDEGEEPIKSLLEFTPLPTTDNLAEVTISEDAMKTLGTIEIVVDVGSYTLSGSGPEHITTSPLADHGVVNEKVQKATEGKRYKLPNKPLYTFKPDPEISKLYRFLFKYRPRPVLILLGIIREHEALPTPPIPQAILKRKFPSLTGAIDLEIQDEEKEVERQAKRIKYLEEKVRNLSSSQRQTLEAAMASGEVIDMTSEDDT